MFRFLSIVCLLVALLTTPFAFMSLGRSGAGDLAFVFGTLLIPTVCWWFAYLFHKAAKATKAASANSKVSQP